MTQHPKAPNHPGTSSVPPKLLRIFHAWLQAGLLWIPKLSEMRLATERTLAFLRAWHYLSRAKVEGDYLEFGVFEGLSFKLSLKAARKFAQALVTRPRFFAFDSFGGLPAPDLARDGGVFFPGEYSCPQTQFERTIRSARRGYEVSIVPGFFDRTLTPQLASDLSLKHAAFVTIDCDLYSSTIQALRFVTPLLHTGTVLYFDDWYFAGGDLALGEAGACFEWLNENPEIHLVDYGLVGIMGRMFIVNRVVPGARQKIIPRIG